MSIYIDADGCPVKEETYKVAKRYELKVYVVANHRLRIPLDPNIEMIVSEDSFDGADDWIVSQVSRGDIVVTADILLAERCLAKKAYAVSPKGVEWTEDNIGSAVAMRELTQNLRHMGENRGGPAPMEKKHRSAFLSKLDQMIQSLRRS